jgi:hypothetical protein
MKTKTSFLVKVFFLLFVVYGIYSCDDNNNNMDEVLNQCEGHAVVIAKGYNEGDYDYCKYYILIRDDKNKVYEYHGTNYEVSIGDTLK